MFIVLLLFLPIFLPCVSSACNSSFEFTCKNGPCIPLEWHCDNVHDCSDRSDEVGCNYLHQCRSESMMCPDGSCISQYFKCDGEADCIDGRDEHHCEYPLIFKNITVIPVPICLSPRYLCKTGGQCLMENALCDSIQDCPDGDDEENCQNSPNSNSTIIRCPLGHKKCPNEDICIPSYFICDGSEDCSDGSDEQNCDDDPTIMDSNICNWDQYKCKYSGSCIPQSHACDGVRDCPYGDDENTEFCRACREKGCEYDCRITHTGTECYCSNGTRLEENGRSCSLMDFCQTEEGKKCQHFCNSTGNGQCYCAPGYFLQNNSRTCRTGGEGQLLLALGSTIRTTPLGDPTHSNNVYQEFLRLNGSVRDIDYNFDYNILFASRPLSFRQSLGDLVVMANNTVKSLRNINGIENVAIDYVGKNVYYSERYPSPDPGIYTCTFDGLFCRRIIKGFKTTVEKERQLYRGLVLNPSAGKMYWIDYAQYRHTIMSSHMDGSNIEILINSKLEEPQGIAFDPIVDNLYFADFSQAHIEKFNLKTKERHIVVSRGVHHPFDLKYFDGYLYWTDWGTESLKMIDTTAEHIPTRTLRLFRHFPMGLAINHTKYHIMPDTNPCTELAKTCPWICVPVPGPTPGTLIGKCLCPMNYKESNETTCFLRIVSNSTDGQSSPFDGDYLKEVCDSGKACLNGGHCQHSADATCPEPYIGERCELIDPNARKEKKGAGFSGFWTFFIIIALVATGFGVLHQKNERVQIFTREIIGSVRNRNVPDWWPILNDPVAVEESPADREPRSFSNLFSSM